MNTFIALLRGINVSGQKKIKMAELKTLCESIGFSSVTTYIQSGNIVFDSEKPDITSITNTLYKAILDHFGFDVPVLVIKPKKLKEILQNNPYDQRIKQGEIEQNKMYFTLLANTPDLSVIDELNASSYAPEEFVITNKVVYFFAANGYGKTKLNNNFFEKKLKCSATTRNFKTVFKLLELSNLSC